MNRHRPLENVIEAAIENADGDKVSIGELLDLYGNRSFGPIFTLLGLLTILPPLSAIPGLPSILAAVIILFSVQMLFGQKHIWLPQIIQRQSFSRSKLIQAHKASAPILKRIDKFVTDRLTWATSAPAHYVAGLVVTLLALSLVPLELVPFAVALPGAAITMIGVALLARDGAIMLTAFAISAAAFAVLIYFSL
jgi:hypothetical protein